MTHTIGKKLINGTEIARRLGYSQQYISLILNGQRNGPKAQEIIKKIKEELRINKIAA